MMTRRDALRRFVLTLLAIVFGPGIYELLDEDELESFVGYAEARLKPGFVRLTIRDRVHQPFRDSLVKGAGVYEAVLSQHQHLFTITK